MKITIHLKQKIKINLSFIILSFYHFIILQFYTLLLSLLLSSSMLSFSLLSSSLLSSSLLSSSLLSLPSSKEISTSCMSECVSLLLSLLEYTFFMQTETCWLYAERLLNVREQKGHFKLIFILNLLNDKGKRRTITMMMMVTKNY